MAGQIILMREFLVVFYGNEISIAVILSAWLFWGAFGSYALGRFADRLTHRITLYSFCLFALSIILALSILAVRFIRPFLNIEPGEIIGLLPMAGFSFVILAPFCAVLGFMFSLGCRIVGAEADAAAVRPAKVYVLEATGSILSGILVSFLLISFLNPFEAAGIFCLLNALAAFLLLLSSPQKDKLKQLAGGFLLIIFFSLSAMFLLKGWQCLDRLSLEREWSGYELLESKNSIYANITVTKRSGQRSFFENGLHFFTVPDEANCEEAAHFALLEHPDPKRVLLIGGGAGGLLEEILKHPVEHVDYLELDPAVIAMAERHLSPEELYPLKDNRVLIRHIDGRYFVKTTPDKYDCVIVYLGDPYTAQLNRYYTVEFFQEVRRILSDSGIISFGLSSSESYIGREQAEFLRSIYFSLGKVFEDIKVIPGDTAYFLGCRKKGVLTYNYHTLLGRAKDRGLELKYVREYYLFSRLSPEKIAYATAVVMSDEKVKLNYDFRPVSYYYDMVFWLSRFRDSRVMNILKAMNEKVIWPVVFVVCAGILIFGLLGKNTRLKRSVLLISVFFAGFSAMALQLIIILSFQVIYGYIYYKIGLVLAAFMAGLALGGIWLIRIMPRIKEEEITLFKRLQFGLAIYPLVLLLVLKWLASGKGFLSWAGANVIFIILPAIPGFIIASQFVLANKIYLSGRKEVAGVAGLTYASDLLGSCLGALLTAVFLIPLLGIMQACVLLAAVGFTVLMLVLAGLKNN